MSVLTGLLQAYEQSENANIVDNHFGMQTVLLPIYHQSLRAKDKNVLKITINESGEVLDAEFPNDQTIIFPITENSVARSGKIPPPHPLEDKMQYCIKAIAEPEKFDLYMKEFDSFFEYIKQGKVKNFLMPIRAFITNEDSYKEILVNLRLDGVSDIGNGEIEYINEKGKKTKHNFQNTFLCFQVKNMESNEYTDVSKFRELHNAFIEYIDNTVDESKVGRCNISGKIEALTDKHRGLMGTAKIISVSNNKETYYGRFKSGDDIIRVGRKTSEKIHLMLKYLLENNNSSKHLADSLYLVNWFLDDVTNECGFDLTSNEYYSEEYMPVDCETGKKIGEAFVTGRKKFNAAFGYYLMLIDKSSNGRISIRYYKELPKSELLNNLVAWREKYVWERWDSETKKYIKFIPELNQILLCAYGIEFNNWIEMKDEKFKKDQFQNLVMAILERRSIPSNIKKALSINIRNRQRYKKQWNFLLNTALAVLSEERKEYGRMRAREEQTRSFLYGRLLAIYEKIENDVLLSETDVTKKKENGENSVIRTTNAARLWNAYVTKPETTMRTLELNTRVYANKMRNSEKLVGLYIKMEKIKTDIIQMLEEKTLEKVKMNNPLDTDFIFGYYAQRKELYSKNNEEA